MLESFISKNLDLDHWGASEMILDNLQIGVIEKATFPSAL